MPREGLQLVEDARGREAPAPSRRRSEDEVLLLGEEPRGGLPVDLSGGGEEDPGAALAGGIEHRGGPAEVHPERLEGVLETPADPDHGGEVVDAVRPLGPLPQEAPREEGLGREGEPGVIAETAEVLDPTRGQIIDDEDLVPPGDEVLREVAPDEARSPGDEMAHDPPPNAPAPFLFGGIGQNP